MGEIFHALEVLNRTMKLGLAHNDLMRAEMGFKSALARQGNPNPTLPSDPVALSEGYELVATLQPRAEALSLQQLATFARKEVSRPRTKVDAKALKQIDKALTAAISGPPPAKVATKQAAKSTVAKKATAKKATAKKAKAKKASAKRGA
jgi:hypothetical protein